MLFGVMWGRIRLLVAGAICAMLLMAFVVHKPACSESRLLHNQPVPAFRALAADAEGKVQVFAPVLLTAIFLAMHPVPQLEPAATEVVPWAPDPSTPHLLSCCFLC